MSNMSYCRFRNTLNALMDCLGALSEGRGEDRRDPFAAFNYEEKMAALHLIKLCKLIADDYFKETS